MAAYASPADLIVRKDARTLGDLVSDSGVRVAAEDLEDDANIQAALDDASGIVDASLLQGKRYTVSDLEGLAGNSLAYLKRLVCDIAFWLLWERRPSYGLDDPGREQAWERQRAALKSLRSGEEIFAVDQVPEAGLPDTASPTLASLHRANLVTDRARGRLYPARFFPQ